MLIDAIVSSQYFEVPLFFEKFPAFTYITKEDVILFGNRKIPVYILPRTCFNGYILIT